MDVTGTDADLIGQLLEDHLKKLREEEAGEVDGADDEAAWDGWDIETDSESDSQSEGWMDVDSDDGDLQLSDSEDEEAVKNESSAEQQGREDTERTSTLATTKVCARRRQGVCMCSRHTDIDASRLCVAQRSTYPECYKGRREWGWRSSET